MENKTLKERETNIKMKMTRFKNSIVKSFVVKQKIVNKSDTFSTKMKTNFCLSIPLRFKKTNYTSFVMQEIRK